MEEKATKTIEILKGSDIFQTGIWIRLFAIVLFSDIFMGLICPMFNINLPDIPNFLWGKVILLYIMFSILAIFSLSVLSFASYFFLSRYISPREDNNSRTRNHNITRLHELAILRHNEVAERIYNEYKKEQDRQYCDTLITIATAMLFSIDAFYGMYMTQIVAKEFSFFAIMISLIIIVYQTFTGSQKERIGIYLSSGCLEQIDQIIKEKSIITHLEK